MKSGHSGTYYIKYPAYRFLKLIQFYKADKDKIMYNSNQKGMRDAYQIKWENNYKVWLKNKYFSENLHQKIR